MQDPGAIAQ